MSTIPFQPSAVNSNNPYISPFLLHLSSYLFSLFLVILSSMSVQLSVWLQPLRISTIPFQPSAINSDKLYILPFLLHLSFYLLRFFSDFIVHVRTLICSSSACQNIDYTLLALCCSCLLAAAIIRSFRVSFYWPLLFLVILAFKSCKYTSVCYHPSLLIYLLSFILKKGAKI
jgi:hypothetical protein